MRGCSIKAARDLFLVESKPTVRQYNSTQCIPALLPPATRADLLAIDKASLLSKIDLVTDYYNSISKRAVKKAGGVCSPLKTY